MTLGDCRDYGMNWITFMGHYVLPPTSICILIYLHTQWPESTKHLENAQTSYSSIQMWTFGNYAPNSHNPTGNTYGAYIKFNSMDSDALVLKHQRISIHSVDEIFIVLDQFHNSFIKR